MPSPLLNILKNYFYDIPLTTCCFFSIVVMNVITVRRCVAAPDNWGGMIQKTYLLRQIWLRNMRQKLVFPALAAALLFVTGACDEPGIRGAKGGDLPPAETGAYECESSAQIKHALQDSPDGDSPDNPVKIAYSGHELSGVVLFTILNAIDKYIELDLSGCTGRSFGAFNISDIQIQDKRQYVVSLTLPESVRFIGFSALSSADISDGSVTGWVNLRTINMPGAEYVAQYAFYGCRSLETVYAPSAREISQNSFSVCPSLQNVSLGDEPPEFAASVFESCATQSQQINLTIPEGAEEAYGLAGGGPVDEEDPEYEEEEARAGKRLANGDDDSWLSKLGANSDSGFFWDSDSRTRNNLTVAITVQAE